MSHFSDILTMSMTLNQMRHENIHTPSLAPWYCQYGCTNTPFIQFSQSHCVLDISQAGKLHTNFFSPRSNQYHAICTWTSDSKPTITYFQQHIEFARKVSLLKWHPDKQFIFFSTTLFFSLSAHTFTQHLHFKFFQSFFFKSIVNVLIIRPSHYRPHLRHWEGERRQRLRTA
jgi:hypothetical protein